MNNDFDKGYEMTMGDLITTIQHALRQATKDIKSDGYKEGYAAGKKVNHNLFSERMRIKNEAYEESAIISEQFKGDGCVLSLDGITIAKKIRNRAKERK